MSEAKVDFRQNADFYEEELEERAKEKAELDKENRWQMIVGGVVAGVVVIGIIVAIIKLISRSRD